MRQPDTPLPTELSSLLEAFHDPAVVVARDYRLLAANRAYVHTYGEIGDQRFCYEASHKITEPCDQAGETCPLKKVYSTGRPQRVLHLHHTPRGVEHVDVEVHPIRDEKGRVRYLLEVMHHSRVSSPDPRGGSLVGRSSAFNRLVALVRRIAPTETPVLLVGESGTGKESVARAVHDGSVRAAGPFVPVDCAGLSEALSENEFFGHEKGAFTGAYTRKRGLVDAARGGTLFLDDVSDMPMALQNKFLRMLETGSYRRIGAETLQKADFRLVCATTKELGPLVEAGDFRKELYYRISGFMIAVPPLRERQGDLPLLAESLLERLAPNRPLRLSPEALACLERYSFPGNVRELSNILERASLLADEDVILREHLPEPCSEAGSAGTDMLPREVVPLEEMERRYLNWALARFDGDKQRLAERLGVSPRTLYRKLHNLRRPGRKEG
jgi:two-component system response regulator HydG